MSDILTPKGPAPAFDVPTTAGQKTLADYAGKYLVIFFYPKDNTPGCTTESKAFSAAKAAFAALNTVILGVSKDSMKKHENFIAKQELTVDLASDADTTMCEDYGVWKEKSMYGKTYMGIERTTILIDPNGHIVQVWPKVKVKTHVEAVLAAVQSAQ